MPQLPLSDELAQQAADLFKLFGSKEAAAKAGNIASGTFNDRLKVAAARGMLGFAPVLDGYHIKKTSRQLGPDGELQKEWVQQTKEPGEEFDVPEGHTIKGVSALLDADGRITAQWVKTKAGDVDPRAIAEWLKDAFAEYKPAAKPSKAPKLVNEDLLTLIPCNDWHLGMFAWGQEVEANWDLKIAEEVIGPTIEDVISRSSPSSQAIVLGGGDLLHADNRHNQTTSGTPQDVDGRYQKVISVATRLMVRTVDAALRRHKHVTVRILPGNHDEHASVAVAYFLLAWYRKEPRVTVDADPSLFFWFRFGSVMLGSTHGHTVKIEKMPGIMAQRRAEDWGATKYRYVHGFHLHHSAKFATESNGVISEVHQAPIPQDAWHYGAGYCSGRSVQAITYHRSSGEKGRVREALMDAS